MVRTGLSGNKALLTFNNILAEARALKQINRLGLVRSWRLAAATRRALLVRDVPASEARYICQRLWVALI